MINYFINRNACPACKHTNYSIIYSKSYNDDGILTYLKKFYNKQGYIDISFLKDAKYEICECKNCNLLFQKEIPNAQLMGILYEKWINPEIVFKEYVNNLDLNYHINYAWEITNIISYFQRLPNELKILDFGMGWGKWCLMAKAFDCEVYGAELSQSRIDFAKSNGINIVPLENIENNQLDFINTEQVFEHLPDPLNDLERLVMALKPGGIIKISVPNCYKAKKRFKDIQWNSIDLNKNYINVLAPLEHINGFTQNSIVKMAEQVNLKKIRIPFKLDFSQISQSFQQNVKLRLKSVYKTYLNIINQSTYLFFQKK